MNTGIFGEGFPYSNFHDLNMDWIIKIAKDFLDQYTHIQEVIANGEQSLQDLTTSGLEQLQDKANELDELLQEWYNTHSEDIANQLADALADLNEWYTTHIDSISTALQNAIAEFNASAEAKALETIASIPDNYTSLSNSVSDTIKRLNSNTGSLELGTLIADHYIQSSNGALAEYVGNSATDFINILGASKLIVSIGSTITYHENAFYTEDETFISSFGLTAGVQEITVPINAKYVRFSNLTANMATLKVAINPLFRLYNTTRLAKIAGATIFPRSDYSPSFTFSGTTVSFICGGLIGVRYDYDEEKEYAHYITMNSAVSVPHDNWCIWNIDTDTIQVISEDNLRLIGDTKYCPLFYNSNGNIRGLFEKYVINNRLVADEAYMWKGNLIIAPYGTADLSISNNDTSIVITCNRYVIYNDMTLRWRLLNISDNPTITVPHDKFLVYKESDNSLNVMTDSEINALTNKQYYVLFYNSNGKMCGNFEMYRNRYRLDQVENKLIEIGESYPSYYDTHVQTKTRIIDTELSALSSGDAFVFITDIHYPNNKMYSPSLIRDICNKSGITTVVLGGDYINRETVKADALIQINRVCSLYNYPDVKTMRVVGNHEFNNPANSSDPDYRANELNASELRWSILNINRDKIVYDPNSLSYYFDNEKEKIRYFVGATTLSSGTVADSIRWIAGQVENVPNDYGVVIFEHTVLSNSGNVVHVINEHLEGVINAMKAKTSYNYLGTTFNYTGKTFDFIACFCGDYHLDMDYTTTDGAKIIATTCDAMLQEGSLSRENGTYSEQAFDVVVINRTTHKVNMTRIGAGSDREFTF